MENVNHPQHYNIEGKDECIVSIEKKYGADVVFNGCLFNIEKYMYRKGAKSGNSEKQDFEKALWYANYAAKLVEECKITAQRDLLRLINAQNGMLEYIEQSRKELAVKSSETPVVEGKWDGE